MSGQLSNSPAEIVYEWLLGEALIQSPTGTTWPGFVNNNDERTEPYVVVMDTAGRLQGKLHAISETQEHFGVQIQVRAATQTAAYSKMSEIFAYLDAISRESVTIGAASYTLDAVTPTSPIIRVGKQQPEDYLNIVTANFVASIQQQ